MKFLTILVSVVAGLCSVGVAEEITGKVVSVIDGNTIELNSEERGTEVILLAGIDCPELQQQFGDEARKFLEKLVLQKRVVVALRGKDRSGKYLGIVMINEDDDVRVKLLKAGLAWTMETTREPDLEAYRQWAQVKGKGLWKDPAPTAPWTFRRQQSMRQPKSS